MSSNVETGPLFQLTNVTKAYTKGRVVTTVLEDFDLTIARGAFLALMGPSGSGKTTLLNLLAGIDQLDRGDITFDGERISGRSQGYLTRWRASNVGFVFQSYNLLQMLTVARNVEMPLLLTSLGARERRDRVDAALQLVGLADYTARYPNELSGGQQQRVAIARAIVADPKILLCDEPTGNLDRASSSDILSTLVSLNEHFGKTILMVTHDPAAAEYARETIVLDKGRVADHITR